MRRLQRLLLLLTPLTLMLGNCGGDPVEGSNCDGAKCDDLDVPDSQVPDSPCDGIMHDLSGRNNSKVAGRLHDPLADMIWKSEGCPTTFQDIMDRLREVDTVNCEGDERSGISTRVVSETAQITDSPTSYRLVTTRACNNRPEHEIVFSLFGVRAGAASMPSSVEIIAFDETQGVFNYYEAGPGEINFFGNSKDMKKGSSGNTRRCAGCHNGGGLVMKELDTPWVHWEGHMNTPGAQELVDANPILGSKATGSNFEGVVKRGNDLWNKARVDFLLDNGTLKDVLEPLFCTVEVNLDNGADFPDSELTQIPVDSLLDPQLKSFDSISVQSSDYEALMGENGQQVPGVGAQDLVFAYPFIERSHIDNSYVKALKERGIIDDEFIKDVLMVDFTRPIFSEDRCALLDFAPGTAGSPEELRQGFIDKLELSPGSPESDFLINLENTGGHSVAVDSFLSACRSLSGLDFLTNAMTITSMNRAEASRMQVFEFQQTLPTDNLVIAPGARLDPVSCEISTSFRPVATEEGSSLSSWTAWSERNNSNIASDSPDHSSVSISGSGFQGFNGGAFQRICGLSGQSVQVSADTSWNVSGGTRWTQIFLMLDGSTPQNGNDVLEGGSVRMSSDGESISGSPSGDCVTVLLKAGSTQDGNQTATFGNISFGPVGGGGG